MNVGKRLNKRFGAIVGWIDYFITLPHHKVCSKKKVEKLLKKENIKEYKIIEYHGINMCTLLRAIRENKSYKIAFNDGTRDWYGDELITELKSSVEGLNELNQEVMVTEIGIHKINEDGVFKTIPIFAFKKGYWDERGDFERE